MGEIMNIKGNRFHGRISILLIILIALSQAELVVAQDDVAEEPYVVEFYYKVKWGYFEEFYDLYQKNHYPILKRLQDLGRILEMNAVFPMTHAGEADRWDMRFTIIYPNVMVAHEDFDTSGIIEELYPDQNQLKKEELRRFELLLEHTDVPVWVNDLSEWRTE